jgi:hypothetical protein
LFLFFLQNFVDPRFGINGFGAMTASVWQARSGQRLISDLMEIGCFQGIRNVRQQARPAMCV